MKYPWERQRERERTKLAYLIDMFASLTDVTLLLEIHLKYFFHPSETNSTAFDCELQLGIY